MLGAHRKSLGVILGLLTSMFTWSLESLKKQQKNKRQRRDLRQSSGTRPTPGPQKYVR